MIPYLNSSSPSFVPRATTRTSHASASCSPAPRAKPRTAAMVANGAASSQEYASCAVRMPDDRGILVAGRLRREHVVDTVAGREDARVDAAREGTSLADDDERAQVAGVGEQRGAELTELAPHQRRERVELVGPVEREPTDRAAAVGGLDLEPDGGEVGHARRLARGRDPRPDAARWIRTTSIGCTNPGTSSGADRDRVGPGRDGRDELLGREQLAGTGGRAEPGREVHAAPDVVVALEQDDRADRHARAERQRDVGRVGLRPSA